MLQAIFRGLCRQEEICTGATVIGKKGGRKLAQRPNFSCCQLHSCTQCASVDGLVPEVSEAGTCCFVNDQTYLSVQFRSEQIHALSNVVVYFTRRESPLHHTWQHVHWHNSKYTPAKAQVPLHKHMLASTKPLPSKNRHQDSTLLAGLNRWHSPTIKQRGHEQTALPSWVTCRGSSWASTRSESTTLCQHRQAYPRQNNSAARCSLFARIMRMIFAAPSTRFKPAPTSHSRCVPVRVGKCANLQPGWLVPGGHRIAASKTLLNHLGAETRPGAWAA